MISFFRNGEYLFEVSTGLTGELVPAVELYENPACITISRYFDLSNNNDPDTFVKRLWSK